MRKFLLFALVCFVAATGFAKSAGQVVRDHKVQIIALLEKEFSYDEDDGTHWSTRDEHYSWDIESFSTKKIVLTGKIGMSHEYEESVIYKESFRIEMTKENGKWSLKLVKPEELDPQRSFLCRSDKDQLVYAGDEGQVFVSGRFVTPQTISKFVVDIKSPSDILGYTEERVNADANYRPRNQRYKNHQRFSTADAWCGYYVLLPDGAHTMDPFTGYVQQVCEGGFVSTVTVQCRGGDVE